MYNKKAQRTIVEHIIEVSKSTMDNDRRSANIKDDSNRGKSWDSKQEEELIEMFKDGLTIKEIAKTMKRSSGGIRARLLKLGLIKD